MIYNNVRKAEFVIRRNRFICDIIIESDGVISESEIAEVENLKALCK